MPSTFFNADLEENVREWADLTRHTPVWINPAIEEAYSAGHTEGITRCFYNPPVMLPLTLEMIHAIAARHWRNGADGLYVFNWFGTAPSYDDDNRAAVDNIGDPLRLKYKNKRYVVMRTDGSFPNCLPHPRQIPRAGRSGTAEHQNRSGRRPGRSGLSRPKRLSPRLDTFRGREGSGRSSRGAARVGTGRRAASATHVTVSSETVGESHRCTPLLVYFTRT